jgi:hypothetical protein
MTMMTDGTTSLGSSVPVYDISEVVARNLADRPAPQAIAAD